MAKPIRIFFSYAHEDKDLMDAIREQLVILEDQGRIIKWHDREILAGDDFEEQISIQLLRAHIILLFISRAFFNSDYIQGVEMKRAFERYKAGEVEIIPILLRPSLYKQDARLAKLQALPTGEKPVNQWSDVDDAGFDIASGILKVVEKLEKAPKRTLDRKKIVSRKNTI